MHLHIVVPDLFWPSTDVAALYRDLRLHALERLLARGRRSLSPAGGLVRWVAAQFGLQGDDPPVAPFRLIGDGAEAGDTRWLCADPVHLEAGIDRVVLSDPALLELDAAEAAALTGSLNEHLAPVGVRLLAPVPRHWYTEISDEELVTTPVEAAIGVVAADALPRGAAGARWRTLLTELQMILHVHPVNAAREARGAPAVNGLWAWGGGARQPLKARRGERWYGIDAVVRGLARAADATAGLPPPALRRDDLARDGIRWFVLEDAAHAVRRADQAGWRDALQQLERDWFAPLVDLLRRGDIGMASVHAVSPHGTLSVETTRSDLRHLWRRPRALDTYLAGPA